ncbi:MAG: hypothetical protein ACYTG7_26080, partial [Planctomycetota bacterium]
PTELIASLISQEESFVAGIQHAQKTIDGSATILLLTDEGIYAARDFHGRTPLIVGEKEGNYCVCLETCAFPNLDYNMKTELGPGEIALITPDGIEQKVPPNENLRICSFLWIYYGYPASTYEGLNVEVMRNRNGAAMARADNVQIDMVAGTGTARPWPGPTTCRSTWWPASPIPAPPMPSATPTRRACPTAGPSSSTRPRGRAPSCPRTRTCATWWPG